VCFLPWVRLHAIRSYYDMVRVLEEFPEVKVTVNIVPSLVEQLVAYAEGASDYFWETGALPAEDLDEAQRVFLFDHFFSSQQEHMIRELPRYADLLERRERARRLRGPAEAWKEFSASEYRDVQTLFDLSWFGFKAREDFPELRALSARGLAYTQDNIRQIHAVEKEILRRILPLYRDAAARGQIEISTSPYAHPILPLLIDTECAREAMPQAPLPARFQTPEDARAQVEEALIMVDKTLGVRPRGMWPSEGSVSQEAARLMAACGIAWTASDDQVLAASDLLDPADATIPWTLADSTPEIALVFRDHDLSDRIGFTYSRMGAEAAVSDLLSSALARTQGKEHSGGLVLVALDGENPWEHYPKAGARFLRALYRAVTRHPALACVSVGEAVAAAPRKGRIRHLRAGSWIHADFGTWIGGPEKNRAWSVLGLVRSDLSGSLADPAVPTDAKRAAWSSLRAAEGSDWFWWLDGQNSSLYRTQFDQVFRGHLRQACEALGRAVPDFLDWPIPSPERRAEEGLAEPSAWLSAVIDGYEGSYFEWQGAVRLAWNDLCAPSTMQRAACLVDSLRFGFSQAGEFLLRLDADATAGTAAFAGLGLELSFRVGERVQHVCVDLDERGDLKRAGLCKASGPGPGAGADGRPTSARAAARKIFELAAPTAELGLAPGQRAGLVVRLRTAAVSLPLREIGLRVPASFSRTDPRTGA
jgi:alpha-amylase/alpha-mannosidase (GH57 family)